MTDSKVLAIGGPHHGTKVDNAGSTWTPMVMMQDTSRPQLPAVAMPTTYILRDMSGEFEEGMLRQYVYAHESIRTPADLMQLLMNYLVGEWIREGGELVEAEEQKGHTKIDPHTMVPSGNGERSAPMDKEPPRSAGGVYLA